jgi:hypothetical protein
VFQRGLITQLSVIAQLDWAIQHHLNRTVLNYSQGRRVLLVLK